MSAAPRAWVEGHGAKVVAAIIKSGDASTKAAAAAALKKIVKGQSPEEWAAGFFKVHEDTRAKGAKATGKGDKGKGVGQPPAPQEKMVIEAGAYTPPLFGSTYTLSVG